VAVHCCSYRSILYRRPHSLQWIHFVPPCFMFRLQEDSKHLQLIKGEQILLDEGSQINVAVQSRLSHCSNCGCLKIKQVSNMPAV